MKGTLVSNTGPIIALSAIDHLEILKGILVGAKNHGLISNVRTALERMRSAGYRIHDDIVKTALEQANEKRGTRLIKRG